LAVPACIVLGALLLLAVAARDQLLPGAPVRVVRVVATEATGGTEHVEHAPASVSVQAPGWVEPDPHPTYVSALADGIVEALLVLEGERVEAGQVVARMVSDDARLAVAQAEAALAGEQALLAAAETRWENPVELERALETARALQEEVRAEERRLTAELLRDEALLAEAAAVYDSLRPLAGEVVPELDAERARLKREALKAAVTVTRRRIEAVRARVIRYDAEARAAARNLELRVDLRRELEHARAAVAGAGARLKEAQLRLRRMEVTASAAGTVMDRLVAPGAKVMRAMDSPTSAHIIHLYDPERLQVRVDVPLKDAANVGLGQPARVIVDVAPDREFAGRVTRFVHQADIGKNTVQVKVAIEAPSADLKPDMLARVKFLGPDDSTGASGGTGAGGLRVFAPRQAIVETGGESFAWVVAPGASRVARRSIVRGTVERLGWTEVRQGLNPGDVLVHTPPADLREGARVRIIGEEAAP